ncbi:KH domain protein [Mycobacterium ulcerans str. Harvey]|uniref:KH domain protein n=1 Tax=Mycobacterium ulcerans str. Harvey TaxID=1299332 RepID=A0ABP3ADD0_MYCUL|nr:KH domain protein [Mycobacterium ulcerans str. Harvey]
MDKIGEVIGPKGKVINSITEETRAQISIEDDGTVFVGATDGPSAQAAIDKINAIANPQLPTVGERFLGTVVKTTDFGAFVRCCPVAMAWCTSPSWARASASPRSRTSSMSATSCGWRSPTSTSAARSRWCWWPRTTIQPLRRPPIPGTADAATASS